MKVILLKDVRNIGKRFDTKDVSDGYALNFLIPNHLAETARPEALKRFEQMKVQENLKQKEHDAALHASLTKLEGQAIAVEVKANEKGHLFKGVHKEKIATLLKEKAGITIAADYIALEKPIKEVGTHQVPITVGDSTVQIAVEIKAKA